MNQAVQADNPQLMTLMSGQVNSTNVPVKGLADREPLETSEPTTGGDSTDVLPAVHVPPVSVDLTPQMYRSRTPLLPIVRRAEVRATLHTA